MFWEIGQTGAMVNSSFKADEAKNTANRAEQKSTQVANEIQVLRQRVDSLALKSQALWELLQDTTGLTDEQLQERVLDVDARDGKIDGKITPRPVPCKECGRPTSPRRSGCLYCGEPITDTDAFAV